MAMCCHESVKYKCPRCKSLVEIVHRPDEDGRCHLYDRLGIPKKSMCPEFEGRKWIKKQAMCRRCRRARESDKKGCIAL